MINATKRQLRAKRPRPASVHVEVEVVISMWLAMHPTQNIPLSIVIQFCYKYGIRCHAVEARNNWFDLLIWRMQREQWTRKMSGELNPLLLRFGISFAFWLENHSIWQTWLGCDSNRIVGSLRQCQLRISGISLGNVIIAKVFEWYGRVHNMPLAM